MITVYSMAFNEEVIMQFFIDHYRSRFPNCQIVIYNNESTDNTVAIATSNGCTVIPYITNGYVDDRKLTDHKNNCWKSAQTDWVLVCDMDELLNINETDLKLEESKGSTIIQSEAYNMVNMEDNFDIANIKHGARCPPYDKKCLFNKKYIQEINYYPGAHTSVPRGTVKICDKPYILYHHNGINIEYCIQRHILTAQRMSEINKRNGWGVQYQVPVEEKRAAMLHARTYAVRIIS